MIDLQNIRSIYFLGIGGIGMSALARYFVSRSVAVAGYDRYRSPLCQCLENEGMKIHYHEDLDRIPTTIDAVVYTPAIPNDHREKQYFIEQGIPLYKRSEILGEISRHYQCIAIAGTHGKTTISTLTAHLLYRSHRGCNAFLGGISKNYNSNLLLAPNSPLVVVEADEYDRSFLTLHPQWALISSMDADHLDVYGSVKGMHQGFEDFADRVVPHGGWVFKWGLPIARPGALSYHLDAPEADYHSENLRVEEAAYIFDLHTPHGTLRELRMTYPGLHNVENAVAALALALQQGVEESELRAALADFAGVQRRFDVHLRRPDLFFIDDYAHHPRELAACIQSMRHFLPGRRLTGVFQPHLYSRTRDFLDDFAESLSMLDELLLLDIYPAREKPIPGIDAALLLSKCRCARQSLVAKEALIDTLKAWKPQVILTLGAGDIDALVKPIETAFIS